MEELSTLIRETEDWLRDNPKADSTARLEMIGRLRELNKQFNKYENESEPTKIK